MPNKEEFICLINLITREKPCKSQIVDKLKLGQDDCSIKRLDLYRVIEAESKFADKGQLTMRALTLNSV